MPASRGLPDGTARVAAAGTEPQPAAGPARFVDREASCRRAPLPRRWGMAPSLLALGSVVIVSLVSLVGLASLRVEEPRLRRAAAALVSFAVGALLGDAFIHLIPETFAEAGPDAALSRSLAILGGMMGFFVIEKLLRHRHGTFHRHKGDADRLELAAVNVIGDAAHNFVDGVLIAASYLASPTLGLSTTLAVLLHELPQELGDFAILIHAGLTPRRALLLNLASAGAAVLGTIVTLIAGAGPGAAAVTLLVPVTAGGFVYIATADLIPELQRDRSPGALVKQVGLIASGIAVMAALTLAE